MEDLFPILIFILIAAASVSKKNKKKKAKAPDSKASVNHASAPDKNFDEVKSFIKEVGKTVLEMADDTDYTSPAKLKTAKMKAKPAKSVQKTAVSGEGVGMPPVRSGQGISLFEDKGCISGSIEHDTHEGDSGYPYGASKGKQADMQSAYAEDIAYELQSMNVQRLRRAIVVSEILDKPKALRRR